MILKMQHLCEAVVEVIRNIVKNSKFDSAIKEKLAGSVDLENYTQERVYEFLEMFDIIYDELTEVEKKEFFLSFIEKIEIYPENVMTDKN